MRCGRFALLFAGAAAAAAACRKIEPGSLDAVRAIRSRVEGGFRARSDGRLTDEQIAMYLRVRRAAGRAGAESDAARALRLDPTEFDWVRGRIVEALVLLDSRRVSEAGLERYGRAIATLREARRSARDGQTAARLDDEIAALERERASLRRADPPPPGAAANAARIAGRRTEIESVGP